MKILHTSDWHLGQIFYNFNREKEFRDFFCQLREILHTEKPDAMLISGDVFDTAAPSNATVSMYNEELLRIQQENTEMQTIVTAGNHDSPSRLASAGILWKEFGVTVIGFPTRKEGEINMESLVIPIRKRNSIIGWVLAVPYMHGSSFPAVKDDCYGERIRLFYTRLREIVDKKRENGQPVIAMGHLTLSNCDLTGHDMTVGTIDSVPADIWDNGFSYVALGHIHHAQHIGNKEYVRYSGSVIPISFDEQYKHSVTIAEFDGEKMVSARKIEIKPPVEIYTIPEKAAVFEEVKDLLKRFPKEKQAYIRAHILIKDIIPSDMFNEASICLEGKKAKLCALKQEHSIQNITKEDEVNIQSLDELKKMTPMKVAINTYRIKKQEEMPKVLEECLQEAIEKSTKSMEDR